MTTRNSAAWWRNHWGHSNLVKLDRVDTMPDGWKHWLQHEVAIDTAGTDPFPSHQEVIEADGEQYLGFARVVARRRVSESRETPQAN